jgi:predicted DNA repair protein MutK
MKFLTVAGTIAMFLVGGGIIVHNIPVIHHWIEPVILDIPNLAIAQAILPSILNGLVGILAGFVTVGFVVLATKIKDTFT